MRSRWNYKIALGTVITLAASFMVMTPGAGATVVSGVTATVAPQSRVPLRRTRSGSRRAQQAP